MSSLDHSLAATTDRRLSVVTDTAANLIAQLSELNDREARWESVTIRVEQTIVHMRIADVQG